MMDQAHEPPVKEWLDSGLEREKAEELTVNFFPADFGPRVLPDG